MLIRVNPSSSTPLYSQVVDQVKHAVASGRLKPKDQLPAVRELASELRINPNTVAKAYRELEQEGFVQARQGSGVYISERASAMQKGERFKLAAEHFDHAIAQAFNLSLKPPEIQSVFTDRLKKFNEARQRQGGGADE